jgi:hypothetical protein
MKVIGRETSTCVKTLTFPRILGGEQVCQLGTQFVQSRKNHPKTHEYSQYRFLQPMRTNFFDRTRTPLVAHCAILRDGMVPTCRSRSTPCTTTQRGTTVAIHNRTPTSLGFFISFSPSTSREQSPRATKQQRKNAIFKIPKPLASIILENNHRHWRRHLIIQRSPARTRIAATGKKEIKNHRHERKKEPAPALSCFLGGKAKTRVSPASNPSLFFFQLPPIVTSKRRSVFGAYIRNEKPELIDDISSRFSNLRHCVPAFSQSSQPLAVSLQDG